VDQHLAVQSMLPDTCSVQSGTGRPGDRLYLFNDDAMWRAAVRAYASLPSVSIIPPHDGLMSPLSEPHDT
jgi:pyruvoyl-dependent arginine decarboxylase (PvlArgDC)